MTSSLLRSRLAQLSPQPQTLPSIYKVPRQLGDVNNKAYEPEMVAIGPYHNGKHKFKTTEELKLRYFDSLVKRKPEVQVEHYVSAISEMETSARDCYAEPCVNLSSTKFTDMLVLDGCFIIEVIRCPEHLELSFPVRSSRRILQRDLILLENQIPFFVLCKLYDLIQGPDQHTLLMNLVLKFSLDVFPGKVLSPTTGLRSSKEVKHILDLIHSNWCPPPSSNPNTQITRVPILGFGCFKRPTISPRRIPCASQLKDANVKFRNKIYDSSTTLFDVEFKEGGKIVMPTIEIEDWIECWLRNLIAYEQFLPRKEPTPVADYALLLDSLINTSKDVHILCSNKIIENMLGSDNAVVDFVNRLTDRVMLYEDSFIYEDTFRRINSYYQKPWNRAVAVYHRDYFSSPWAYIAFLGALLLLLLTIVQTLLSALQVYKPTEYSHP